MNSQELNRNLVRGLFVLFNYLKLLFTF